jgi:hypothetical protein
MSIALARLDDATWLLLSAAAGAILLGMLAVWPLSSILARRMARRGKVWVGVGTGRTRLSPLIPLIGLLSGVTAVFFLVAGLYDTSEQWRDPLTFYFWAGTVGLFAVLSLVLLLGARETWEWDATGLRWRSAWRRRAVEMRWPRPPASRQAEKRGALRVRQGRQEDRLVSGIDPGAPGPVACDPHGPSRPSPVGRNKALAALRRCDLATASRLGVG